LELLAFIAIVKSILLEGLCCSLTKKVVVAAFCAILSESLVNFTTLDSSSYSFFETKIYGRKSDQFFTFSDLKTYLQISLLYLPIKFNKPNTEISFAFSRLSY